MFVAGWPVKVLAQAGYDGEKAENSTLGRIWKIVFQVTSWISTIIGLAKGFS